MLQIVNYFQNYKDITIPNDDLIKIIENGHFIVNNNNEIIKIEKL